MIITRFAPSPTGILHVGNISQPIFDFVYSRKESGGKFILRIEDTDKTRYVAEGEKAIFDALDWLGLKYDEGPYKQSERLPIYQEHAKQLIDKGRAYYCFCSKERLEQIRKEKQESRLPPMYDRTCRKINPVEAKKRVENGEPFVIRMIIPDNEDLVIKDLLRGDVHFNSDSVDDQVLIKSDGFPTYHLAATVDDHLMGITYVIRGEEWLSSAPKHVLLYRYFGWQEPIWVHLPLFRNLDKSKLSKRKGHTSVFWYKEQGYLPEALINFLALTIWGRDKEKEIFDLDTMIKEFKFEDVRMAAPVFDIVKLDWINGVYIRNLSVEELKNKLIQFDTTIKNLDGMILDKVLPLIKDRLKRLNEFWEMAGYFFNPVKTPKDDLVKLILAESKLSPSSTISNLSYLRDLSPSSWVAKEIDEELHKFQKESGTPPRQFFMPIRIALCGGSFSPPLGEVIEVLGKSETLKRIEIAKEMLI